MKALTVVLGTAILAASHSVLAQQSERGWYAGVSVGQAQFSDACAKVGTGVSCEDKDGAWRIFGGYEFNRNLAVEIGYADLGEAKGSGTIGGGINIQGNSKATAFDVVGVGILPIGERFGVYGKLGLYAGEISGHGTASLPNFPSSQSTTGDDSASGGTFGLGARYSFTRHVAARVEWQRYLDFGGTDVDVLSVGGVFRF